MGRNAGEATTEQDSSRSCDSTGRLSVGFFSAVSQCGGCSTNILTRIADLSRRELRNCFYGLDYGKDPTACIAAYASPRRHKRQSKPAWPFWRDTAASISDIGTWCSQLGRDFLRIRGGVRPRQVNQQLEDQCCLYRRSDGSGRGHKCVVKKLERYAQPIAHNIMQRFNLATGHRRSAARCT